MWLWPTLEGSNSGAAFSAQGTAATDRGQWAGSDRQRAVQVVRLVRIGPIGRAGLFGPSIDPESMGPHKTNGALRPTDEVLL